MDIVEERSARRRVLAVGAAGLGTLAAAVLGSGRAAASHNGPIHGDSSDGTPAVLGTNSGAGPGVRGVSASGSAVQGETTSNGSAAVEGRNNDTGFNAAGVRGFVFQNGMGVDGQSIHGVGVSGTSHNYIGVSAGSLNGIAFQAFAPAGIAAIRVGGRARFGDAGSGTVPARVSSLFVPFAAVTGSSHITVTLTSDPGNAAAVQWIERAPGSGFTIHLTRDVRDATTFTWLMTFPFVDP